MKFTTASILLAAGASSSMAQLTTLTGTRIPRDVIHAATLVQDGITIITGTRIPTAKAAVADIPISLSTPTTFETRVATPLKARDDTSAPSQPQTTGPETEAPGPVTTATATTEAPGPLGARVADVSPVPTVSPAVAARGVQCSECEGSASGPIEARAADVSPVPSVSPAVAARAPASVSPAPVVSVSPAPIASESPAVAAREECSICEDSATGPIEARAADVSPVPSVSPAVAARAEASESAAPTAVVSSAPEASESIAPTATVSSAPTASVSSAPIAARGVQCSECEGSASGPIEARAAANPFLEKRCIAKGAECGQGGDYDCCDGLVCWENKGLGALTCGGV